MSPVFSLGCLSSAAPLDYGNAPLEFCFIWGDFVLEIIVTNCTHSKSATFWLMYVPASLECSILERTLKESLHFCIISVVKGIAAFGSSMLSLSAYRMTLGLLTEQCKVFQRQGQQSNCSHTQTTETR